MPLGESLWHQYHALPAVSLLKSPYLAARGDQPVWGPKESQETAVSVGAMINYLRGASITPMVTLGESCASVRRQH